MSAPARSPATRIACVCLFLAALCVFAVSCGGRADSSPEARMLEEGRRLYVQECQLCHGDAGTGKGALPNTPVHAPRGHTWHHPDGQLKELILGTLDYPGRTMPGFADKMTGSEVDAVLEYMKSNWPADLREAQEEISRNWLEQTQSESDQ